MVFIDQVKEGKSSASVATRTFLVSRIETENVPNDMKNLFIGRDQTLASREREGRYSFM